MSQFLYSKSMRWSLQLHSWASFALSPIPLEKILTREKLDFRHFSLGTHVLKFECCASTWPLSYYFPMKLTCHASWLAQHHKRPIKFIIYHARNYNLTGFKPHQTAKANGLLSFRNLTENLVMIAVEAWNLAINTMYENILRICRNV